MGKQCPRAGHKGGPSLVCRGASLGASEGVLGVLPGLYRVVIDKKGIEKTKARQRVGVGRAAFELHPRHIASPHEYAPAFPRKGNGPVLRADWGVAGWLCRIACKLLPLPRPGPRKKTPRRSPQPARDFGAERGGQGQASRAQEQVLAGPRWVLSESRHSAPVRTRPVAARRRTARQASRPPSAGSWPAWPGGSAGSRHRRERLQVEWNSPASAGRRALPHSRQAGARDGHRLACSAPLPRPERPPRTRDALGRFEQYPLRGIQVPLNKESPPQFDFLGDIGIRSGQRDHSTRLPVARRLASAPPNPVASAATSWKAAEKDAFCGHRGITVHQIGLTPGGNRRQLENQRLTCLALPRLESV